MTGRFIVTGYGAAGVSALRQVLGQLRGGDPLAPVQVACPSALAAVSVRRAVAGAGLANVRFGTLKQIVAEASGRGRRPLTSTVRAAAVRTVLDGPLAGAADPMEQLFAELDDVADDDTLDRLASVSDRGADVAQLYRAYASRTTEYARLPELCAEAAETLPGALVLYAPTRIAPAERRLIGVLQERLGAVLCATDAAPTGFEDVLPDMEHRQVDPATAQHIVVAPDAEEEVRLAVRRVLQALADGIAPDRIVIAYRSSMPYARLIQEQLAAADVPHHGAAQRTLADSVAGRTLLGLVTLPQADFPRAQVMAWLRDAPITDDRGARVPAGRWDRLSRDAGVARNAGQWEQRLSRLGDDVRNGEAATELRDFVRDLTAECARAAQARRWSAVSDSLRNSLDKYLGDQRRRERWGYSADGPRWLAAEHGAHTKVLELLESLAELDGLGLPPSDVAGVVQAQLRRAMPGPTTLGRGVAVAPVRDLAGTDFDLVLILGMTESAFPPRLRENPVLRDADIIDADIGLPTLADRRADERRHFLAALAAGATTVLSYPRADTRAQRAQHPAPWLLEAAADLHGQPVTAADLDRIDAPWLDRYDSFEAALLTTAPASGHEYDVVLALHSQHTELEAVDSRYARGRIAIAARQRGEFGPWLGGIAPLEGRLAERGDKVLSATALQTWAECPHSFLHKYLLQVRGLAEDGEQDEASALDRGTLVHGVLEEFFATELGRPPNATWTGDDLARACEILDQRAQQLEETGQAGRPLLWQAYLAKTRRQLGRVLAVDSALRAESRARPLVVEDDFGRNGAPPLVLELPRSGPVAFSGSIDRIDRADDGALVVIDYKTGKGSRYDAIPQADAAPADRDLVDRGRRLQLVLYGMAARERYGTPDTPVHAWYWFVEQGALRRGATVQPADEQRLLEVLDVAVTGIRGGVYPVQPGEFGWRGWESCGYCAYDRVCASARGEQWQQVRTDPRVAAYAALAEPTR